MRCLLNGHLIDASQPALHVDDRGWQYGDGLFETMLLKDGRIRFVEDHFERLQQGCDRLGIPMPSRDLLLNEIQQLCQVQQGVVKLTLTRGRAERGYRPAQSASPTRLLQLFEAPLSSFTNGVTVRWCDTRLARNATLAGLKHCNRLEQVLAQAEWRDSDVYEGLMLDTEGELICATMSNVFVVIDGALITPDLRYSGVAGVMRKNILRMARTMNIEVDERAVRAEELTLAQEVFVCNAVRGIMPVVRLDDQHWPVGNITHSLVAALQAS